MGKVHGSLARAGKVKGQTPKVEAAEDKKKQPRGRAKKRLQYVRFLADRRCQYSPCFSDTSSQLTLSYLSLACNHRTVATSMSLLEWEARK